MSNNDGCICGGNWRTIVRESEPLLDSVYTGYAGNKYRFFGVVHASDDYYYGMSRIDSPGLVLLTCVGRLSDMGFILDK